MLFKEAYELSQQELQNAMEFLKNEEGLVQRVPQADGSFKVIKSAPVRGTANTYPVYDDKNYQNTWQPGDKLTLQQWSKTVQGTPTIYYGNRLKSLTPEQYAAYMKSKGVASPDLLDSYLASAINRVAMPAFNKYPYLQTLDPRSKVGVTSFFYNLGSGMDNKSSILAAINNKDMGAFKKNMKQFIRSKGKVSQGLIGRRDREAALISTPAVSAQQQTAAPNIPAAAQPASPNYYTVKKGDTINGMWKNRTDKSIGWGQYQRNISMLNPGINLNLIHPGQRIRTR